MARNNEARIARLMPNNTPRYIRVYDNDETADRYTVVYTGRYRGDGAFQYVGMSSAPFHPQGVCQHGESQTQIDVNRSGFAPVIGRRNHLGKRIRFEDLPEDCRKVVTGEYIMLWDLPLTANPFAEAKQS